jgi:sRNA-binding protein
MNSLQRLGLAVAVTILLLFGIYRYGYHNGWYDRDVDMQAAIAQKNEEARQQEHAAAQAVAARDEQLRKANDELDKKQAAMRRLAAAGQLRLPATSCAPATTDAAAASRPVSTDVSDVERQTVEALIDIAAEGDRAIHRYNACIATYNQVMEQINGDR